MGVVLHQAWSESQWTVLLGSLTISQDIRRYQILSPPSAQLMISTCWSLWLIKIWLESRLLCLSYSIAAYTRYRTIMWQRDVIHITGSTYCIAMPSEEDRAKAIGSMQKIGEVWLCGFRVIRANRQTDRHTDHNTSHPSRQRSNRRWMILISLETTLSRVRTSALNV